MEDLFQERHIVEASEDVGDGEMGYIEPLLYGKKKEEEEEATRVAAKVERLEAAKVREAAERSWKKHDAVMKSICSYDPKARCFVWTRFPFQDFAVFDLDEECEFDFRVRFVLFLPCRLRCQSV